MARIIFEDMKLNKARKQLLPKQAEDRDFVDTNLKNEVKIENTRTAIYPEEKEDISEVKIEEYIKERATPKRLTRTPQVRNKTKLFNFFNPYFLFFVLIIICAYGVGLIFQKADIDVSAKHQMVSYSGKTFTASKEISPNAIDFEIMITSDKKDKNIILTEPKDVSIKAQGSITIYNEYSPKVQKIAAGAYVSDTDGKTYKIDEVVTIPGYKLDVDKKIIPGQIVANITSFLPGEAYNGSPADFHFTAFKSTLKYNKIYAKLASPIEGGATGIVYTLDDTNKASLEKMAQTSFRDDLLRQVKAQVPPGYILYDTASAFTYKVGDNFLSKTPDAVIPIEGTLAVVLLKKQSLIDNILKISFPGTSESELSEIKIPNLNDLIFNFTNPDQAITKDLTTISFSLAGEIEAIWSPDLNLLKSKLIGIKKDNVLPIFKQDPGIAQAKVIIFPPWQNYIPNNLSKISLTLK